MRLTAPSAKRHVKRRGVWSSGARNGIARLRNEGVEAAKFVRVLVSGRAMVAVTPPQHVAPGEVAEFQVFGERREGELMLPDAHLVVQWYSVDDVAWLWSFAW